MLNHKDELTGMMEFKSYCHAENCSELHNKIVRIQLEKPTEKITINANSALNFSLWVAHRLPANPSLIIEEEGKISEFAGEIKRPDVLDYYAKKNIHDVKACGFLFSIKPKTDFTVKIKIGDEHITILTYELSPGFASARTQIAPTALQKAPTDTDPLIKTKPENFDAQHAKDLSFIDQYPELSMNRPGASGAKNAD